jgi:glycosyltransferase involved in cell wall biosynthesis
MGATVLPNFVPDDHVESLPPLSFDERRGVVFLGRLQPEKGALDVVELARRAPALPVTIVGSGDLEPQIRAAAAGIDNLHVAGFVSDPDLREILRTARLLVIPSRCQDAGPLVPLEAMSHATPVVAYSMGGLGEYVTDADGGRVVPVDVHALTVAATELHEDKATWQRLSRHGYEAVAARHTPGAYAERIEAVYEEAMSSTEGRR